jgi:hypothetical protein
MVNRLTKADDKWLGTLGESKSILNTQSLTLNAIEEVLMKYAKKFASLTAENIRNNKLGGDTNASGALESSIKITPVKFMGKAYTIEVNMLEYWKYVNYGTRGTENGLPNRKMPPIKSIITWIKDKQISLTDNGYKKNGKVKKVKSNLLQATAYKIANKIKKYGTEGTFFVTYAIDDIRDDLTKDLRKAIKRDFTNLMKS